MKKEIQIYNESGRELALPDPAIKKLLKQSLQAMHCENFEVRVIALGEDALREMKKEYFHEDLYTDIISFVLDEEAGLEGELYCSPGRIRNNAAVYHETESREFARVLIHGAAHLCGYRDGSEAEKAEMRSLEDRFLNAYYDKE